MFILERTGDKTAISHLVSLDATPDFAEEDISADNAGPPTNTLGTAHERHNRAGAIAIPIP